MPKYNHLIATDIVSPQQSDALKRWVENHEFEKYESTAYELDYKFGRPRNNLYKFMLADVNCQVIMKVSHIHKRYKWTRQLELILKHYLRDANRNAFLCCREACSHNLAAPKALAYWQKRDSLTRVKSYFLYQHIEASFPWFKTYEALRKAGDADSEMKRDLIRRKIINALKCLHQKGIRHGDIVTHNILMSVRDPENLSDAKIYFIDYDGGSLTKIKYPAYVKRFFDLRDLRKMQIDNTSPYDMLKLYLGNDYHPLWSMVLTFWRWGGFNLFQWRNPDTCQVRKHLK